MWSAAIFVVVAIAAVAAFQWYAAHAIDRSFRERNQKVIENGIAGYAETLAEKSFPQAYWDDAVVNLDNRFSAAWAREYVGVFFWRTERIERIATLDRDDHVTFAMQDGREVTPLEMVSVREAAAPLIARVRAIERTRGRLPLLADFGKPFDSAQAPASAPAGTGDKALPGSDPRAWTNTAGGLKPIFGSSLVRIDGSIFAMAAVLVQPDSMALPRTDRSAIILLAKRLDPALVSQFAREFVVSDARLRMGHPPRDTGWSQARLRAPAGEVVAVVEWRSIDPGKQLVRRTAPALAIFALLLALAAWLVLRKGRAIAQELSDSEARASTMAFSDKLTGLPNRAALERAFEDFRHRLAERGKTLSVSCIDVDRFKAVNDSYGHPAGDALLRQVAERLETLCEPDHVVGRFGGDEFIMMCPTPHAPAAARMGELVVAALSAPFDIGPARVFVGASVGILTIDPGTAIEASEAFRRADLAMYRAKELGRGQYAFYEAALDDSVRARREVQEALREALKAGGLAVHYQPQVDEAGKLVGAEALARWPEASGMGIPTSAFIRLAEETGLIDELGMKVMQRVFADAARWPGLRLAINLSAVQLRSQDFSERIERLVAETGVDPSQIEFEITEGLLLDQNQETLDRLRRLRALGCRIALDDFGTGYCGLSYLHQYPIDGVKIDMSFTGLLGQEPRAQTLVETIVALAAALDLDVIAEGVETEDQHRRLFAAGCRRFQGFRFGKPMAADAFCRFIAGRTAAATALQSGT